MKLLSHFPAVGLSNTYLLGPEDGGDAILIDPGRFDVSLLDLIEDAGFNVVAVLASHDHWNHVQGIKTLLKVYPAVIYSGSDTVLGFSSVHVNHGESIRAAGFDIDIIDVKGHSDDSRVYKIGPYLFTGDILSAGRIGSSPSLESHGMLVGEIRTKLLSLDDDLLVLPGHGPPTTLGVERRWNSDLAAGDIN